MVSQRCPLPTKLGSSLPHPHRRPFQPSATNEGHRSASEISFGGVWQLGTPSPANVLLRTNIPNTRTRRVGVSRAYLPPRADRSAASFRCPSVVPGHCISHSFAKSISLPTPIHYCV